MQLTLHRFLFPAALIVAASPIAGAQQTVGTLYASDASVRGTVMLAGSGTAVASGSSIEAGSQPATLKLDRGGAVEVCQGTKLSLTSSQNGREMMFSLNSGNLELNYPLGTEADTLLTPDLRLLLPGPGTVHVAVRISPQGDTCVQSLPANASAIVVSESMGDATYQVKPDEAVVFKAGHLNQATHSRESCGCPPAPKIEVAQTAPPPPPPAPEPKPVKSEPVPPPVAPPAQTQVASAGGWDEPAAAPAAQPLNASGAQAPHLAMEAPFVYNGDAPGPDMREMVVMLRLETSKLVQMEPTVLPPPKKAQTQTAKNESHHLFGRIGAFFASIFH